MARQTEAEKAQKIKDLMLELEIPRRARERIFLAWCNATEADVRDELHAQATGLDIVLAEVESIINSGVIAHD